MKKLGLLAMPLMAVSFLASCNNRQQFTVTFNANSGALIGETSVKVNSGTLFRDINKPTGSKEPTDAYTFNGWALVEDSKKNISDDYKITNDLTVYAIYVPKATAKVTFDVSSTNCQLYYGDKEIAPGTPYTVPAVVGIKLTLATDYGTYLPVFEDGLVITGDVSTKQFDAVKQEINISIPKDSNCNIKAITTTPRSSLEEYKWSEISQISGMGLAKNYFKVYNRYDRPELSTKKVQLTHQDLDNDGGIDENEVYQTVRIIGFNQDVDNDGNENGITFEFADLISDENGYSLASFWQDTADGKDCNFDYLNSTIRKNLVGDGNGSIIWYEKDSDKKSDRVQTVLDMLPNDLNKVIKITKKKVNLKTTGDWVETEFADKLFLLAPKEMGYEEQHAELDVVTYKYYEGHTSSTDAIRIKQQIKGIDGARTTGVIIDDSKYGTRQNYAGFNYTAENNKGSFLWLRSPHTFQLNCAWNIDFDGCIFFSGDVYSFILPVAPAFCI